jgi:hypothetical protein
VTTFLVEESVFPGIDVEEYGISMGAGGTSES